MNHKYPLFKISIAYLTVLISGAIFSPDSSLLIITTSTSIIAVAGVYYYRQNCTNSVNNTQIVKILDITILVSIYLLAQLNLNLSGYHDKITKITSIPSGKIKSAELIVIDVLNINDILTSYSTISDKFGANLITNSNDYLIHDLKHYLVLLIIDYFPLALKLFQ